MAQGYFVISLDFELLYGMNDLNDQEYWKSCVLGGRDAVGQMLCLFEENEIHATWAAVGMLMAENKEELCHFCPSARPGYDNTNYVLEVLGDNEDADPYHYAKSLIGRIQRTPGQEIGSHTFSHYYCLKGEQTPSDFQADIDAAAAIARKNQIELKSFVFPRNQMNDDYLNLLSQNGFTAVRGNESSLLYHASGTSDSLFKRAARLADAYVNLSGMNCYHIDDLKQYGNAVVIPSSRFLRRYSRALRVFERLKLQRIKKQMKHAAIKGKIFHLWWHPHNFGLNTEKNMDKRNNRTIVICLNIVNK